MERGGSVGAERVRVDLDGLHRVGVDVLQIAAIAESFCTNGLQRAGDSQFFQRRVVSKGFISYCDKLLRQTDRDEWTAIESSFPNRCDAARHGS